MEKYATTDLSLHPLIKKRWSPRAFSLQTIEKEKLERMIEAARWSPSCYNEQPWRFIIGIKGQNSIYDKIFSTLAEGNQSWAKRVPCLLLLLAKKTFTHNGKRNRWSEYDCGQAAAHLSIQAMEESIYVHQMAGFDKMKATQLFAIQDDFTPVVVIAAGYQGDVNELPEDLKKMELSPRKRLPVNDLIL
jgi:nitroreductase